MISFKGQNHRLLFHFQKVFQNPKRKEEKALEVVPKVAAFIQHHCWWMMCFLKERKTFFLVGNSKLFGTLQFVHSNPPLTFEVEHMREKK